MALELLFFHIFLTAATEEEQQRYEHRGPKPLLSHEDKHRRDRKTPRISIRRYTHSPFKYMFFSANNQALLNCCGVDHAVFRQLLRLFTPVFRVYTFDDTTGQIRRRGVHRNGSSRGRKKEVDAIGCLGLVLF